MAIGTPALSSTAGTTVVSNAGVFPVQEDGAALTALQAINTKTPSLGQALAAGSVPVVLTAAQISTLTPLSSVTVTQATGTNLHTVVDSGTITAVTSITNALPSGTNTLGSIKLTDGTNGPAIVSSGTYGKILTIVPPHDTSALTDTTGNTSTGSVDENFNRLYEPVLPFFFNGTTWDRQRGDTTNGLDVDVTRLPALAAGSNVIGAVTQSGSWTVDTELPAAAALSDAFSNPTAPAVGSFLMGWDATAGNWERLKTDTSGILSTQAYLYGTDDNGTNWRRIKTDANGVIAVAGDVANAAADSGNPVKVGGKYNSSFPTLTNGQRGDLQLDVKGNTRVALSDKFGNEIFDGGIPSGDARDGSAISGLSTSSFNAAYNGTTWDRVRSFNPNADGISTTSGTVSVATFGHMFNGSTWDRVRGDTTNGLDVDVTRLPTGTNAIGRVGHDITGIGHGVTTVTTAGTDVALAASTACKRVTIQAQTDNTSLIAVGATGVDATIATGTGIILYPGDVFELEIDNLADVFIDSLVSGEGVRYCYFT